MNWALKMIMWLINQDVNLADFFDQLIQKWRFKKESW
jgi:hypothetical protein